MTCGLEFNLTQVVDSGDRLPITDEGEAFFNFGASDSQGKTLVSASFGARIDITDSIIFGAAYQMPLTDGSGSDLLNYRVTTDLIFKLSFPDTGARSL